MNMLHMYYQTRWSMRNDPALGFVMVFLFAGRFAYLQTWKELSRCFGTMIERQMWAMVEHEHAATEPKAERGGE